MLIQNPAPGAAPPTPLTRADFEAMLTKAGEKAGEAGARSYADLIRPKADEAKAALVKQETAPLHQVGVLGGLVDTMDSVGGLGIPFGSVLVGAIPGVVVGEVIDGLVSSKTATGQVNWINPAVKIGAGWVGVQYGRGLIGNTGAMFFAGTLALQALSQILPLDRIVANIVGMFRKITPQPTAEAASAWLGQHGTTTGAYYSEAFGR